METVSHLDAKNPLLPFSDDSATKQRDAAPELREAAADYVNDAWDYLSVTVGDTEYGRSS